MKNTHIQWCNHTWNTHIYCKKVSEGCKFCYMFRDMEEMGIDIKKVTKTSKSTFYAPLDIVEPGIFFANSWSDFFIEEADAWRNDAWKIIKQTQDRHIYLLLTKRPERVLECLPDDWGEGYPNVWIGVSVENQNRTSRIDILKDIPAAIRFVSFEPLLENINLNESQIQTVDWAILGGESGNETGKYRYRPCEIDWFEHLIDQFEGAPTAIFVKQLGTHLANQYYFLDDKGGNWNEWGAFPKLQRREHPIDVTKYFKNSDKVTIM
ncbi:DUF5131 family protein [Mesonia sp. K7]|uniref:DUF5131 family protein n=1 Tax=Mesonia sp. K7 TaxID=2218606 RepID=UPI000DAA1BD5|nr:DUF5131 family protein [Mesonia sp. K7]PZD77464.1 hypothetical protein DNG35_09115 [Mesonia sp. K7]